MHTAEPKPALSFSPEHARYLGHIIAEWNGIESMLCFIFSWLLSAENSEWAVDVFYSLSNNTARLDILEAVAKKALANRPESSKFETLLEDARSILSRRNEYAHASYESDDKNRVRLLRFRYDLNSQKGSRVLHLKELEEMVSDMCALSERIFRFYRGVALRKLLA